MLNLEIVKEVEKVVIIDHHRKSQDFIQGAVLSYMEPYASSTAELVTEMIQYMVDKPKLKAYRSSKSFGRNMCGYKEFLF